MKDENIISVYSLEQAIEDGVLVELFKNNWQELSGGKPIVATSNLYNYVTAGEITGLVILLKMWDEYKHWRKNIMPTLPEEEQLFVTSLNGNKIWIIENGDAFTLMFPEDY